MNDCEVDVKVAAEEITKVALQPDGESQELLKRRDGRARGRRPVPVGTHTRIAYDDARVDGTLQLPMDRGSRCPDRSLQGFDGPLTISVQ